MPPNDNLRTDVARIKRAAHDSPQKFACILGRQPALLINPDAKLIAEVKKEIGGNVVINGTCFSEDGIFIFETPGEPPSSLGKAVETCLKKYGGSGRVETRKSGTGEEESDEAETEEPLKAKVTEHVKKLQTRLAGLAKTDPQKVAPVRDKIAKAGAAFKSNHFEEAEQFLKEAEELL